MSEHRLPSGVRAMIDDESAPTCTLADYRRGEQIDPNLFWRIESGHVRNLLDQATEEIDRLRTVAEAAEELMLTDWYAKDGATRDASLRLSAALDALDAGGEGS